MARTQQNHNWQEPASKRLRTRPDDSWDQLRDELETLLDHVASQQQMSMHGSRNNADISRSGQHLAHPISEKEEVPPMRVHSQDRLQSAIDQIRARHSRPAAPIGSPHDAAYGTQMSGRSIAQPAPRSRGKRQNPAQSSDLSDLSDAIMRIGNRLERFETTLAEPRQTDQGVEEINTQMEQLTNVVEMLANSVGERGAIKRVENHIAKLADRLDAGSELDFDTLDARLDVLSQAFERLSDLQGQQADRHSPEQSDALLRTLSGDVTGIHDRLNAMDMEPIENCLRNVYDRLDVFEQSMQRSGHSSDPAIEKLSQELALLTQALDSGNGPITPALVADRVDTLHARIDEIVDAGAPAGDLKMDMKALHSTVLSAVEPRFYSLESQIDAIADNFTRAPAADATHYATMEALEKQIQALSDKLERTGKEISNLQNLYDEPRAPANIPDLNALADMVAERTGQALAKSPSTDSKGIDSHVLDGFEARMSELFERKAATAQAPDFSAMEKGIANVSERLIRLENSLSRANLNATNSAAAPAVERSKPDPTPLPSDAPVAADKGLTSASIMAQLNNKSTRRHRHPGMGDDTGASADAKPSANTKSSASPSDAMPKNPTEPAPLNAPSFAPPAPEAVKVPVPVGLQADDDDETRQPRQQAEPELLPEDLVSGNTGRNAGKKRIAPQVADEGIPPAPVSSFERGAATSPTMPNAATSPDERAQSNRSTFIAAARRSVQASTQASNAKEQDGSSSLIGKALARFQKNKSVKKVGADGAPTVTPNVTSEPAQANAVDVSNVSKKPAKSSPTPAAPQGEKSGANTPAGNIKNENAVASNADEAKESLLSRHSKPILLAAAVVAVSLLTLNLVNQRLSAPVGPNSIVGASSLELGQNMQADLLSETSSTTPSVPLANLAESLPGDALLGQGQPEIGTDIVSSINRADIDPGVRIIDPTPISSMPVSLAPASLNMPQALSNSAFSAAPNTDLDEALGPLAMRQAAANGDARAQFEVAAIYAEGRAVAQDLALAAQWYERAAAQGHAPASYRLGNMYENGTGVGVDLSIASFWYQSAAEAGNRMSMHNLAALAASGAMGDQNFGSAAGWFERAAALGLTDSQFNLGMLHARGLGVPQDLTISYKWFSIAAIGGDQDAAKARDDVARSLNADVVLRLQNEVANWSPIELNVPANFAPIGTWDETFDPGPRIENQEVILQVQSALNRLGYDTGIPDGLIGPKTTDAIAQFESATGMVPTGEVNPRLLAVLGSQPV